MFRVLPRSSADRHAASARVREIPVTALAAAIGETRLFQIRNQLANLARHVSIKLVSLRIRGVNNVRHLVECRTAGVAFNVCVLAGNGGAFMADNVSRDYVTHSGILQKACGRVPETVKSKCALRSARTAPFLFADMVPERD